LSLRVPIYRDEAISATRLGRPSCQLTGENIAPILLLMYHSPVLSGDEIMKNVVKEAIRDEKGQVLILALILLVVGGLILTPLLGLMSTGLLAGQVYERKTDELYAADAGVEDAIWRIQTNNLTFVNNSSEPWHLTVNDRSVDVVVYRKDLDPTQCGEDFTYQILSTAATGDGGGTAAIGSGTQIEAYITATVIDCSILDHLVTIQEDLDDHEVDLLQGDLDKLDIPCPTGCTECEKCGKAYDYNSDAYRSMPRECKGCIAVYNFPDAGWPTENDLSARYWDDVENLTADNRSSIDLDGTNMELGPLKRLDTLEILNGNNKDAATLTLTGTFYITGDTEIGMVGGGSNKPNLTIELNGNTIFVASNSTGNGHEAFKIGPWCTINGPGALIAIGDIYFQPNGEAGANEEPAFVLSVSGTTTIQPNVNFLGAIAGKVDANIQSGDANVNYPTGGFEDLDFPYFIEVERVYSIASWEINPP
jgi:hypothetical protein